MKSKLRNITVGSQIWKYVVDAKEVRIYKPDNKQIFARVKTNDVRYMGNEYEWRDEQSILPSDVKEYIKKNLVNERD